MQYPERNLFLRAIVRELGFKEGYVYYDRKAREAGESKYPLKKMLAFSIDGITLFFCGSFEIHYIHRLGDDTCCHRYDSLCLSGAFQWCNDPRLDFDFGVHVVYWWNHYHRGWHYRIVYRENIYGGKTSP